MKPIIWTIVTVWLALLGIYVHANLPRPTTEKTQLVNLSPIPSPTPARINEGELLNLVQKYRSDHNLPTYSPSDFLCSVASTRLEETKENWSHQGFIGNRFCTNYCQLGENLAKDYIYDSDVLNGWLDSPSHKLNLDKPYTHTCLKSDGNYVVMIYGYY